MIPAMTSDLSDWFAAIDLGSNSFHLLVVRHRAGRLQVLDRHREMVRLAAGIDAAGHLSQVSQTRALDCLSRFQERIRSLPRHNLRVVGTNALRTARKSTDFLSRAEAILGREIEIVSGREEARLIYLGVCYALEDDEERRLAIDIGGGSTELILGAQAQPRLAESLYMGCVAFSQRYFANGRICRAAMEEAYMAAMQELGPVEAPFREHGWDSVVGASGTILAVSDILRAEGWSLDGVTRVGVKNLVAAMVKARHIDRLSLEGLSEERRSVLAGGVAILLAVMDSLGLEAMKVSEGALREGVIIDLLGRFEHNDIRNESIRNLAERFHVDRTHAARVENTALALHEQVANALGGSVPACRKLLAWAAQTHEIGLDIAHAQYHKHGGYLLTHMDLPGFSQMEQRRVSLLVRAHRRKLPVDEFSVLEARERMPMLGLACILRLAVVLHRSRVETAEAPVMLDLCGNRFELALASDWLAQHPLTRLDLEQECEFLTDTPFALTLRTSAGTG